jgi:hypothetical protein
MGFSNIQITFPDVASRIDDVVQFTLKSGTGNVIATYWFKYTNRFRDAEEDLGALGLIYPDSNYRDGVLSGGTHAANQFRQTLADDYSRQGQFLISLVGTVLTVNSTTEDAIFTDVVAGQESIVINNTVESPVLRINSSSITTAPTQECTHFNLDITTNRDFVKIITNGVSNVITPTSTYSETLSRGTAYTIILEDSNGEQVKFPSSGFLQVETLNADNFSIKEISDFSGSSAIIKDNEPSDLVKQYSINNVDWQTSATFDGLTAQTYTLYIKDLYGSNELGCVVTKQFTITETPTSVTDKKNVIQISNANSISFVKRETIDNINTFKNVANLLSHERNFAYLYCNEILFQNNDSIKIQFKSSWDSVSGVVRKSDGTEEAITINKRTDNINKFTAMDGVVQSYTYNKSIIYFTSGFYYDINDNQLDPFDLNGNLPEFAKIGAKIEIAGSGVGEILDIFYLDSIKRKVILTDIPFSGIRPLTRTIRSYYDVLSYEIYDFNIDWITHGNGLYDVVLNFVDSEFGTISYQSENINIADEHENTLAIKYFNTNNRDIFHKYDIQHFIRVPAEAIEDLIRDDIETNITDTSAVVVKSKLNEVQRFIFEPMARSIAIKLSVALSSEYVFINGIGYSKFEPLELEQVPNTNLLKLAANLLINENSYSNIDEYVNGGAIEDITFDVPIVDTDNVVIIRTPNNFIKGSTPTP